MLRAARGQREVDGKPEPHPDLASAELLKALAPKIWGQCLLWSAVLTAVTYLIPF